MAGPDEQLDTTRQGRAVNKQDSVKKVNTAPERVAIGQKVQ